MAYKISPFYSKAQSIIDPKYKPENKNTVNFNTNNTTNNNSNLGPGSKFVAKNLIKEGLKKGLGKAAGKVFGVATTMLSSQKAYARQQPEPEWYSGPSPFDKK